MVGVETVVVDVVVLDPSGIDVVEVDDTESVIVLVEDEDVVVGGNVVVVVVVDGISLGAKNTS